MTTGTFVSNAPEYDKEGRALCDGLPCVWQKGTHIVNTQDHAVYVSDGTQWTQVAPADTPWQTEHIDVPDVLEAMPEPVLCPKCKIPKDNIAADDYICADCRHASIAQLAE